MNSTNPPRTIRLFNHQLEDLPLPSEEVETIDYFKIHVQIGNLRGTKQVKVYWCTNSSELIESEDIHSHLIGSQEIRSLTAKHKTKISKTPHANKSNETTSYRSQSGSSSKGPHVTPSGSYQANLGEYIARFN